MARPCGVRHAYVIKLRRETAGNVPRVQAPHIGQESPPSAGMSLLTGEVLAGCGLSPAWIQRLFSRLAAIPPRSADRLCGCWRLRGRRWMETSPCSPHTFLEADPPTEAQGRRGRRLAPAPPSVDHQRG